MPKEIQIRLLLLIIMIGAGLRLFFLYNGLPELLWIDSLKFVISANLMAESGDLEPHSYQYPGLFPYLLAAIYKLTGAQTTYASYLIARLVIAISGIALILVTYLAGRRIGSSWGALIAAALTAVSITLVTFSRITATDVLLTCFMASGVYMLSRGNLRCRDFVLAGVFLGLSAGTKFTGLYLGPFLVVAAVLQWRESGNNNLPWRHLGIGLLAALGVFVLTTPWIVVKFPLYWDRLQLEMIIQQFGQIGRVQLGFMDYLFSDTITWEQPWLGTSLLTTEGPLILIAGVLAIVAALSMRFGNGPIIHALFVVIYLAVFSRPGHLKAVRFLIPILPSLFVLCGWAVEKVVNEFPHRIRNGAALLAGILLLSVPVTKSSRHMAMINQRLTTDHAKEWMQTNIQAHKTVFLSPLFVGGLEDITDRTEYFEGASRLQYRVPNDPDMNVELTHLYSAGLVDSLRAQKVDYFVSNSFYDDAFTAIPENQRWFPQSIAAYAAFKSELHREAELVYSIQGFKEGRPGPDIRIYHIPASADDQKNAR